MGRSGPIKTSCVPRLFKQFGVVIVGSVKKGNGAHGEVGPNEETKLS